MDHFVCKGQLFFSTGPDHCQCIPHGFLAVSYTHLDVYKRQVDTATSAETASRAPRAMASATGPETAPNSRSRVSGTPRSLDFTEFV